MNKKQALELALTYAAQGIPVFPAGTWFNKKANRLEEKRPLVAGGFTASSTDPDRIRVMFERAWVDDVVVALHLGKAGLLAVDVDVKGAHDGISQWQSLDERYGFPDTAISKTPSGGFHAIYRKGEAYVDNTDLAPGINIRSDAGYIIAPGSMLGEDTWVWEFQHNLQKVVAWPEWLQLQLESQAKDTGREHWKALDREQLNDLDRRMLDLFIEYGGTHPRLQNNTVYLTRPVQHVGDAPSSNGCSIGFIGPGVAKIWTDGWVLPNGRELPINGVFNIAELEEFNETGKLPKGKEEAVAPEFKNKGRFPIMSVTDMKRMPRPEYLIKKWLARDTVSMLVAPSDTGKTFQAIDWAMHLALGIDWNGFKVKKAIPVMYVIGESQSTFINRIEAWQVYHELTADLHNFFICPTPVNLFDTDSTTLFIKQVEEMEEPPAFIIIDTLARAAVGADENSAKDMGKVMANAERLRSHFKACVLLVHHTGWGAQERLRGSSAVEAALINAFLMKKNETGGINLTNTRQKEGLKEEGFAMRLEVVQLGYDEDGDEVTSCVMVTEGESVDTSKIKLREENWFNQKFADAVRALQRTGAISEATAVGASRWQAETGIPMTSKNNFSNLRTPLVELKVVRGVKLRTPGAKYWAPTGEITEYVIPRWED